jgi:hypothetical protein
MGTLLETAPLDCGEGLRLPGVDAEPLHAIEQRSARHPEEGGGALMPSDDTTGLPKNFDDVVSLHFGKPPHRVGCARPGESPKVINRGPEDPTGRENDRSLNHVLQLANISWPVVFLKESDYIVWNGVDLSPNSLRSTLDERFDQRWNIFTALPQWRYPQRKHAETIIEVGSKLSCLDHTPKVTMRGGDKPNVSADCAAATQPLEFLLLKHPEEFRLEV